MSARTGRPLAQGDVLWEPPADARERFELGRYLEWLRSERGLDFPGYEELWRWSVSDLEAFWASIWDFFEVRSHAPYERVLGSREMPGARVVPGRAAELRRAHARPGRGRRRGRGRRVLADARADGAHVRRPQRAGRARAGGLEAARRRPGDRVVAYLPNIPETLVAFLATASLGAIWATCPPEFGVAERSPSARAARAEGAARGRRLPLRREARRSARRRWPRSAPVCRTCEAVVHVPYLGDADDALPDAVSWETLLAESEPLAFEPLPFVAPAVRALLLRHDRPAEGDRALPRRHPRSST